MGVTEGNGLLSRDSGLRGPGRAAPRAEKPQQESQDEHRSEDARLREGVRAAMKNLGHTTAPLPAVTGASVALQFPIRTDCDVHSQRMDSRNHYAAGPPHSQSSNR